MLGIRNITLRGRGRERTPRTATVRCAAGATTLTGSGERLEAFSNRSGVTKRDFTPFEFDDLGGDPMEVFAEMFGEFTGETMPFGLVTRGSADGNNRLVSNGVEGPDESRHVHG